MKTDLTISLLQQEAKCFCELASRQNHTSLIGITDGKAVGTYIEHLFQAHLTERYTVDIGNSARGIDLPNAQILTDIKVTSIAQPQSSCPFRNARQKIYGLGYNLLVFVYRKQDAPKACSLQFTHCAFVEKDCTADYTTTRRLREMLSDGANKEDILSYFEDIQIPGDEVTHSSLAEEVLLNTPCQGYLTVSNALQWRLQYTRVISLHNDVDGVVNYEW